MRSVVPLYEWETPPDLASALGRMAREPGAWKPFAGGTDLMVLLEAGKLPHRRFLNIWKIGELRGVETSADRVSLGALATYTEIRRHDVLAREFPLLGRAAAETGSVATQNRGTIGGNIANASPAADSPPALLVYDAEIELVSARGSRRIPYANFHTGYKTMDLAADELIWRVHLPRGRSGWRQYYRKVGTRRAQAISKVCFAAAAKIENGLIAGARIALASVAPAVLRSRAVEQFLLGRRPSPELALSAGAELARELAPIDDMRSTARYRLRVAQNLLAEFLETLG
ncbi:MAG TPA: xanthine dehydrogenase family protein subunit M [Verrucomicrobiae bacterium]|nr:xanthine dehydrogenase family protein subunit M [Verrucomicrobiae bacterium]